MPPILDLLPAQDHMLAVLVLAEPGTAAWEAALGCIARQTVPPSEIIFAGEDEGHDGHVPAGLPGSSVVRRIVVPHTEILGARLALLSNEARSPLVTVLDSGDRWGPGYIRSVQDRLLRSDADTIAAIGVRSHAVEPVPGSADELHFEDALLCHAHGAHSLVYRREAMERVGGWDPNLGSAAAWDLQLRLLAEWRICLIDAEHAWQQESTGRIKAEDRAALRSRMLRRALRRSPELMGLLLLQGRPTAGIEPWDLSR